MKSLLVPADAAKLLTTRQMHGEGCDGAMQFAMLVGAMQQL